MSPQEPKPETGWWEKVLANLSEQPQLSPTRPKPPIYQKWLNSLPDEIRDVISDQPAEEEPEPPEPDSWWLVVANNGEWPTVQEFSTPDELVDAVQPLEGCDAVVLVFRGKRAQFTRKPHRYLMLPGENSGIPFFDTAAMGIPPQFDPVGVELVIQEDGYIGPAELTLTPSVDDDLEVESASKRPRAQDEDTHEEDEDDSEDE